DLQKLDRDELIDQLTNKAYQKIQDTDLSEGEPFLEENFGLRSLCGWVRHKFGIEVTPDEFADLEDRRNVAELLIERAEQAYNEKEKEYPVLTGISAFTARQGTQVHLDPEGLASWMLGRFNVILPIEEMQLNRDDLKAQLIMHSQAAAEVAREKQQEAHQRVAKLFGTADAETTLSIAAGNPRKIDEFATYLDSDLSYRLPIEDLTRMDREQVELLVDRA